MESGIPHSAAEIDANALHQLIEDAQRYRDYAEMSSDWYWEQDAAFRFTYFSREFEEITGVPKAVGLGKTRWEALSRERLGNVDWEAHKRLLAEHRPFRNFEYPGKGPDGRLLWFRVSGKPRFDEQGRFAGYFGIASDITSKKTIESHLQQAERLAAIGQLAAGMAHEINNPVGFVRSNLKTFENYLEQLLAVADACAALPELTTPLQRALHAADIDFLRTDAPALLADCRRGLDRVGKILADLREFGREGQTDRAAVDIHECLASALRLATIDLAAGVAIAQEYAALPAVRCRPGQINQVALALLANAIQALPQGGGKITLRTGQDGPGRVWFEVADDGCGIAPEHLPRLFEPFFTTRPVGQGTGLGLTTAFDIITEHGGRIDVESTPGAGSRFRVTLPVISPAS
ncbi:nitrogen regulation protein NR(II) [Azoarcus sp. KH32C]|uniref:two-component system sensor histidine kinase NtrB n=1 Tax=Azoarcus sp. KH32C TaxID=748247 RepID=UPI0002386108|nr:ATP-binding protein [Azoarcus sp. KH32C]BAL23520.1 putative PAS/PAC sensor signal transduction histidine kinase [Azoarcus sp. KH32C]